MNGNYNVEDEHNGLKSDYFRIEMYEVEDDPAAVNLLKSDYFRIEIS